MKDYVLLNGNYSHKILEVGVRRGPEINSDRCLVRIRTKIRLQGNSNKVKIRRNITRQVIQSYGVNNTGIAHKFRNQVEKIINRSVIASNCSFGKLHFEKRESLKIYFSKLGEKFVA